MEKRILGIDTGTNSLGWAIVERKDDGSYVLINKGVNLFQEGVKIEKGIESSRAAERTEFRSMRRHYWRRKIRKISLLAILSNNGLCPPLSKSELKNWRLHNIYPTNEAFLKWESTSEGENLNPYYFRHLCLTQKLDLQNPIYRYILGRALYHINQRRGFLSNRKESTKESDGKVKEGIDNLSVEMREAGCEYLGEYFYQCYQHGVKIRNRYTSRKEHFLKEFKAICSQQELDEGLAIQLEKAIFYQRPLKSQKGSVGVCVFERGKSRCPISHPLYEEFRMYSFINNIKVKTVLDPVMRPLTEEEKEKIKPLFYRKSKGSTFDFKDIAKKIAGRATFGYYKKPNGEAYLFNYFDDSPVQSCPVTAGLMKVFGDDWERGICEVYECDDNKPVFERINDIWHALFFFDDNEKLIEFAERRLQLDTEKAVEFSKIVIPQGYASLSIKAIRNILPFLKDYGLIYSKAVFLANVHSFFTKEEWAYRGKDVISRLIAFMEEGQSSMDGVAISTLEEGIKNILEDEYGIPKGMQEKLYHPSKLDAYPKSTRLGSPRIASIKNPMAMRALFRLRKVVNALLKSEEISGDTSVHIEFARELNDANRRAAINDIQRDNKKEREQIVKDITPLLNGRTPTDTDILKYHLWKEQNGVCIYTGKQISISDVYGAHPQFDIEHTIPRSVGGDSTRENLTLCDSLFNRGVKKTKLPSQLANHDDILQRISSWKEKVMELDRQIASLKKKSPTAKEEKDKVIRQRHYLTMQRNYWRDKYKRFEMKEVPEGFSRRQGTDISVISRYARLYLQSVFEHVSIVKGIATADFRKMWGIQDLYTQKERVNHVHHCIDAITIACIGHNEYDRLARYYHDDDQNRYYGGAATRLTFPKPWDTFVEDVKSIQDSLITSHYSKDTLGKQTRKKDRVHSKGDKKMFLQGDTARGRLHQETYYGAIERNGEIVYVVRKSLESLENKDIENVVDETVKQIIKDAVSQSGGSLKEAVAKGIWMNKEKHVPIKKVRLFARIKNTLDIREQRDQSRHEYKRQYHVANDGNYMLAIYKGRDAKGKEKREFSLVNLLEAVKNTKEGKALIEPISSSGYPLYCTLKQGLMVLLYQDSPEEVYSATKKELSRRLYKVVGLSSDPRITLCYHQEARQTKDLIREDGAYKTGEVLRPLIRIRPSQFNALVQHHDFEIDALGNITFIGHD